MSELGGYVVSHSLIAPGHKPGPLVQDPVAGILDPVHLHLRREGFDAGEGRRAQGLVLDAVDQEMGHRDLHAVRGRLFSAFSGSGVVPASGT